MTAPDEVMTRFGHALALSQQGEQDQARDALQSLWKEVGPDGDPLHRLSIAHALADVQGDLHDELAWDLQALHAADSVSDQRAAQVGVRSHVAAFYPSLHLNLGEDYRKLGDLAAARQHLDLGRAAVGTLPDDEYGRMIKGGLAALADRLAIG